MNTGQVIEIAREWVDINAPQTPGFLGAHLMGAVNFMPKDSLFPPYKDVDLHLILENAQEAAPSDLAYRGLILEVALINANRYSSPDMILSDPGLAPNLAVPSILVDSRGMLSKLHASVAREYTHLRWVTQRCAAEKTTILQGLAGLQQANSPMEVLWPLLGSLAVGMSGLIAVANLRPPTHRRCLILLKELLSPINRLDLHEGLLDLMGFAHLSCNQVESSLQVVAEAFDLAVKVTRTPVPLGFKLKPHVRPYIIDAAHEMIEEGFHREAMGWILAFLLTTLNAIHADASMEEKLLFQAKADHILGEVGWDTMRDKSNLMQQSQRLVDEVFRVADKIVSQNPEIKP